MIQLMKKMKGFRGAEPPIEWFYRCNKTFSQILQTSPHAIRILILNAKNNPVIQHCLQKSVLDALQVKANGKEGGLIYIP